jgi:hypothetical protein
MSSLWFTGTNNAIDHVNWDSCDASGDCYLPWGTSESVPHLTLNIVHAYIPTDGVFTNFRTVLSGVVGTSGNNFHSQLIVNGDPCSDNVLSCDILGSGSETTCTTDTDTCAVSEGDLVALAVWTDGTPNTVVVMHSMEFVSTSGNESILTMSTQTTLATNIFRLINLTGFTAVNTGSGYEWQMMTIAAVEGDLTDFGCVATATPGGAGTRSFTVYKECDETPVITNLVCDLGNDDTTCDSGANTAEFNQGEYYCIRATTTGTTATPDHATCGVKLTADNAEFQFNGGTNADPSGAVNYMAPGSVTAGAWVAGSRWLADRQTASQFTALSIFGWVQTPPGGSETYDFDIDDGGANFDNCEISASGLECSQTAQSHTIADDILFAIEITPSGGPPEHPIQVQWAVGASVD